MSRRLIMMLTIIQLEANPYFQIVILTILSFLNLGYVLVSKPYLTVWANRVELVGEGVIYCCMWSNMLYLMYFQSDDSLSTIGYYQMGFVSLMMIVNLSYAISDVNLMETYKYFGKKAEEEENHR